MKKLICFIVLCFPLFGLAQNKSFEINGSISGLNDKSKIFLVNPDDPTDTIASTISKQNSFTLKGSLQEVKLYNLAFLPSGKKCLLFLDNNKITLKGDINTIQQLELTGSPAHASFIQFQQKFDPFFKE